MSPKLTPAAVTRIRTSPGPGPGTGASVIRRRSCGPFRDVCCRARMVAGMLMAIGFLSSACVIEAGPLGGPRRRFGDDCQPLYLSNDQEIVSWRLGAGQGK